MPPPHFPLDIRYRFSILSDCLHSIPTSLFRHILPDLVFVAQSPYSGRQGITNGTLYGIKS
jgi:hypothetical protein